MCAEHPIVAKSQISWSSVRSRRPAAPDPAPRARRGCGVCHVRGVAHSRGARSRCGSCRTANIGEHKGVWGSSRANVDMERSNYHGLWPCQKLHAGSMPCKAGCMAAVSWADSRVAHCVRRASTWLPLLVTSCVREDAHVTEAQRGHPRHAQVHRHDSICDHVPWDPYYP